MHSFRWQPWKRGIRGIALKSTAYVWNRLPRSTKPHAGTLSATLAEKPWQNCQNLISNLAINRLQWDNINLAAPFDVFEAASITAIIHETNNCIIRMVRQFSKQFVFSHKTSQLLGQKYPTRPPTHLRKLGATCATYAFFESTSDPLKMLLIISLRSFGSSLRPACASRATHSLCENGI